MDEEFVTSSVQLFKEVTQDLLDDEWLESLTERERTSFQAAVGDARIYFAESLKAALDEPVYRPTLKGMLTASALRVYAGQR